MLRFGVGRADRRGSFTPTLRECADAQRPRSKPCNSASALEYLPRSAMQEFSSKSLDLNAPAWAPWSAIEPLTGGFLNDVFRVRCAAGVAVLKHYRPKSGGVPLDAAREAVEAHALSQIPSLAPALGTDALRPPRLLARIEALCAILIEYLEARPLASWVIGASRVEAKRLAKRIGAAIAGLHGETRAHPGRDAFDNRAIQRARAQSQYAHVETWLKPFAPTLAKRVGPMARSLGGAWSEFGPCIIMGDLSPAAILVDDDARVRIIDWEFAHAGFPEQDTAHFIGHCLLNAMGEQRELWLSALGGFAQGYEERAGGDALYGEAVATHAVSELVARWAGPFATENGRSAEEMNVTIEQAWSLLRMPRWWERIR